MPSSSSTPNTTSEPKRKRRGRVQQFLDRLQLGVRPSYSRLLSAKSRDRLGDGGFSIRPSYYRLRPPRKRDVLEPDYSFSRQKYNGNRLLMATIGAQYRHNFRVLQPRPDDSGDKDSEDEDAYDPSQLGSYPYVGASLSLVGARVRVPIEGLDANFKFGVGADLVAGYQYKTRLRIQASVTGFSTISRYNFSSVRLGLDYKL